MNQETKYQLVKFNEDGLELEVTVSPKRGNNLDESRSTINFI